MTDAEQKAVKLIESALRDFGNIVLSEAVSQIEATFQGHYGKDVEICLDILRNKMETLRG